jgi:hypothetical protein
MLPSNSMAISPADETDGPATLHRVMQSMIGEGLRRHYRPPQKLSHELFVLLLQLKEEEAKRAGRPARQKSPPQPAFAAK